MLADHVEETIFEILLHISICYPPGALQPDLVDGPFQPRGKGVDFLMVPLYHLVKILHKDIE